MKALSQQGLHPKIDRQVEKLFISQYQRLNNSETNRQNSQLQKHFYMLQRASEKKKLTTTTDAKEKKMPK